MTAEVNTVSAERATASTASDLLRNPTPKYPSLWGLSDLLEHPPSAPSMPMLLMNEMNILGTAPERPDPAARSSEHRIKTEKNQSVNRTFQLVLFGLSIDILVILK